MLFWVLNKFQNSALNWPRVCFIHSYKTVSPRSKEIESLFCKPLHGDFTYFVVFPKNMHVIVIVSISGPNVPYMQECTTSSVQFFSLLFARQQSLSPSHANKTSKLEFKLDVVFPSKRPRKAAKVLLEFLFLKKIKSKWPLSTSSSPLWSGRPGKAAAAIRSSIAKIRARSNNLLSLVLRQLKCCFLIQMT